MKYGLLLTCLIATIATTSLDATQQAPKKRKHDQLIERTSQSTPQSFAKMAKTATITAEDFDKEMEEICRAPHGEDSDETNHISSQQTIEVPHFRLLSSISAAELKAEDEAEEQDSDKDENTSDENYKKRHKKDTKRETKEVKAIQQMIKQAQRHKTRLSRSKQCTNEECKKWHSISPFISRQEYETIKANKHWTCSDNYWNVGDSFCDETDEDGKKIEGGIIHIEASPEEIEAAIQRGLAATRSNAKQNSTAKSDEKKEATDDTKKESKS